MEILFHACVAEASAELHRMGFREDRTAVLTEEIGRVMVDDSGRRAVVRYVGLLDIRTEITNLKEHQHGSN